MICYLKTLGWIRDISYYSKMYGSSEPHPARATDISPKDDWESIFLLN